MVVLEKVLNEEKGVGLAIVYGQIGYDDHIAIHKTIKPGSAGYAHSVLLMKQENHFFKKGGR